MNQAIFDYFNNFAGKSAVFDSFVVFCAEWLPYILVAVFLAILIFSKKTYREKIKIFVFTGLSVFISRIVITEAIRYFYHVSRPFVNNNVNQLIFHETSGSFPSGHAAFFFALAMAVYLAPTLNRKWWGFVFFAAAALIGVARVIAGIHWPYDILAGAIVGIFSAFAVFYLTRLRHPLLIGEGRGEVKVAKRP